MSRRYKIVLAFDGTAYSGYQLQSNGVTVQQRLEEALAYLDQQPVRAYGSSRTDAGVHARGFCCHFDLEKPIPVKNLVRAMNARLPEDIRVLKAVRARADFDARSDAKGKEYRYFLYNADILPPHLVPYWAFQHRPLDVAAMQAAAAHFVGKHDFVSFAANPRREISSTVRQIFSFTVRPAHRVLGQGRRFPLQAGPLDGGIPRARGAGRGIARCRCPVAAGLSPAHRARAHGHCARSLPLEGLLRRPEQIIHN